MFELRSKALFFTYPQCEVEKDKCLDHLKEKLQNLGATIIEYVIGREEHKDGGKHLHAYVHVGVPIHRRVNPLYFDMEGHHPNIEAVRGHNRCLAYCAKDGDYITNVKRKVEVALIERDKEKNKLQRKVLLEEVRDGKIKLVDAVKTDSRLLEGYSRLKRDVEEFQRDCGETTDLADVCGIWLHGPALTGKTHIAKTLFGTIYEKGNNKWFDHYNGRDPLLLDDVDGTWKETILGYIKWWADKWAFYGETKGGLIKIRPRKCVVTSNYTMEECLTMYGVKDNDMYPYIRRFKQFYIDSKNYDVSSIDPKP